MQSTAKATAALSLLSAAPFVARGRVLGANDNLGSRVYRSGRAGVEVHIETRCGGLSKRGEKANR